MVSARARKGSEVGTLLQWKPVRAHQKPQLSILCNHCSGMVVRSAEKPFPPSREDWDMKEPAELRTGERLRKCL